MEPTNRAQRRHPEQLEQPPHQTEKPGDSRPTVDPQAEMRRHDRVPDDLDPRAKSSGHAKMRADKWNQ